MELQAGKTIYSEGTFPCNDYPGCQYQMDGRCIYNVIRLQIRPGKACYEELLQLKLKPVSIMKTGLCNLGGI
ncbi:MAG: hypothetical protein NC548_13180 [Lachnospiraceae bacterium]|nr:hypothetical protein [Lachnospiraceae bacterium]MCM1230657.1 hypothetical protein [Ruminococcus flavefaciens]MCM1439987.1 hypothetical protein [Roseburia sp.]